MVSSADAPAIRLLLLARLHRRQGSVGEEGRVERHDVLAGEAKRVLTTRWDGVKAQRRAHGAVGGCSPILGQAGLEVGPACLGEEIAPAAPVDGRLRLGLGGDEDVAADVPRGVHGQGLAARSHAVWNAKRQGRQDGGGILHDRRRQGHFLGDLQVHRVAVAAGARVRLRPVEAIYGGRIDGDRRREGGGDILIGDSEDVAAIHEEFPIVDVDGGVERGAHCPCS